MKQTFFEAYVDCALWSSTDDGDKPLNDNYGPEDIAPESLTSMRMDCHDFREANAELLAEISEEQAGHDFWLTRNHHGAGFWDRGLGKVGDQLTKQAHAYGECYLYVGDDGKLYSN